MNCQRARKPRLAVGRGFHFAMALVGALGGGDVEDGEGAGVPGFGAAAGVPGDKELVAGGGDGEAVGALEGEVVFFLIEGVEEGEDFFLVGLGVVLDDGRAVAVAGAVGAGDVVEVAAGGVGVDGGDVGLGGDGDGAEFFDYFGFRVERVEIGIVGALAEGDA